MNFLKFCFSAGTILLCIAGCRNPDDTSTLSSDAVVYTPKVINNIGGTSIKYRFGNIVSGTEMTKYGFSTYYPNDRESDILLSVTKNADTYFKIVSAHFPAMRIQTTAELSDPNDIISSQTVYNQDFDTRQISASSEPVVKIHGGPATGVLSNSITGLYKFDILVKSQLSDNVNFQQIGQGNVAVLAQKIQKIRYVAIEGDYSQHADAINNAISSIQGYMSSFNQACVTVEKHTQSSLTPDYTVSEPDGFSIAANSQSLFTKFLADNQLDGETSTPYTVILVHQSLWASGNNSQYVFLGAPYFATVVRVGQDEDNKNVARIAAHMLGKYFGLATQTDQNLDKVSTNLMYDTDNFMACQLQN